MPHKENKTHYARANDVRVLPIITKKPLSYIAETAKWFEEIGFNHFCTFTTSKPISSKSCRRIATRIFPQIAMNIDPFIAVFWASEPFELKQGEACEVSEPTNSATRYHFHALIRLKEWIPDYKPRECIHHWYTKTYGRCDISPISKGAYAKVMEKAALIYCAKYIRKKKGDYDLYFSPYSREKQLIKHSQYES